MPLQLIPYGKGSGKYWLIGIVIATIIFGVYFSYEVLADAINNGEITNPALILFGHLIYPIYFIVFWCLKVILNWGIFAAIPLAIIIVVFLYLLSFIKVFIKKLKK